MRTNQRGETDFGETLVAIIFMAAACLVVYGGYALWQNHFAKPAASKAADCQQACAQVSASWQWSEDKGCTCGSR